MIFHKIERSVHAVEKVFLYLSGALFMVLMLLGAADVLGRYLIDRPIRGTLEISEILMGAIVFLSWAYTQRIEGHVKVDLFIIGYPPRLRKVVDFLTLSLSLLLFIIITKQSTIIALRSWHQQRVIPTLDIPTAPIHSIVPIGAALLCLELIIQMVKILSSKRKG
ncbi:MAG: TRAP transporter small permease [Deltaproteobacteria bacterium]|nr:TRAP transporter small permease [Deltaproteobacteria bacterium]